MFPTVHRVAAVAAVALFSCAAIAQVQVRTQDGVTYVTIRGQPNAAPQAAVSNITIDPTASKTTSVTETATLTGVAFAGTASNSIVPASYIDTALRYGDVAVTARRNVSVNQRIALKNAGASSLLLRADEGGAGAGTVTFGQGAQISRAGMVSILFDPSVNPAGSVVNNSSYVNPKENFAGDVTGGGTLTAYMLVNTVYDLQNIQNNLSGVYALGKPIDASPAAGWNSGAGFAPIGTYSHWPGFSGLLDGQYQTIDKLTINLLPDSVGLFGSIAPGGIVRNLGLTNVSIIGTQSSEVGGLVGTNMGTISGAYVTGSVLGKIVGALAGSSWGTISGSYAGASVTGGPGSSFVGGLVGDNDYVVNGEISGVGAITQSYATGPVTDGAGANGLVGGLVGYNDANIAQSYSTGLITGGANSTVGGLVGRSDSASPVSSPITNSYWDTVTTGQAHSAGSPDSAGLTTAQLKSGLPKGFDPTVWGIVPTITYPELLWNIPIYAPVGQLNPNQYSDADLPNAFKITQLGSSLRDKLFATLVYDQQLTKSNPKGIDPYGLSGVACLSTVATMIVRGVGAAISDPASMGATVDLFQNQSSGVIQWPPLASRHVNLSNTLKKITFTAQSGTTTIPAPTKEFISISTTNLITPLASGLLIIHGKILADSKGDLEDHFMLVTGYIPDGNGGYFLLANDPLLGLQVRFPYSQGIVGSISDVYDPRRKNWIPFNYDNVTNIYPNYDLISEIAQIEPHEILNNFAVLCGCVPGNKAPKFVPDSYEGVNIN